MRDKDPDKDMVLAVALAVHDVEWKAIELFLRKFVLGYFEQGIEFNIVRAIIGKIRNRDNEKVCDQYLNLIDNLLCHTDHRGIKKKLKFYIERGISNDKYVQVRGNKLHPGLKEILQEMLDEHGEGDGTKSK